MSLLNQPAAELLARSTPEELRAALIDAQAWSRPQAEGLDYVLSNWVRNAIATERNSDELESLRSVLAATQLPRNLRLLEEAGLPHGARWRALDDLLELQLSALADRAKQRDAVMGRKHVRELLELAVEAGSDGVPQTEVREVLGLRPANASRLMRLLERAEYIDLVRVGTANRIVATEAGCAALSDQPTDATAPDATRRRPAPAGKRNVGLIAG